MAVFYGVFFLLLVPTAAWELNRGRNNEGRGQKEKHFDLERRRINTNQKRKTHRKNHQPRRLLQLRSGQLGFTFSELPVLQTGKKKLNYDMTITVVIAIQTMWITPTKFAWLHKDFNPLPMASTLALLCSTNWAMKTHTLGADRFVEFILPHKKKWNMEWRSCELRKYKSKIRYLTIRMHFHISHHLFSITQSKEHLTAEREVTGLIPGTGPLLKSLKITEKWMYFLCSANG